MEKVNNRLAQNLVRPLLPYLVTENFEVLINKPEELWTDSRGGMTQHKVVVLTEQANQALLHILAASKHKHCSIRHPILQDTWTNEETGERWRVTGALPPVSNHTIFSFRKLRNDPLTDEMLRRGNYFVKEAINDRSHDKSASVQSNDFKVVDQNREQVIINAIHNKQNIVISGATGSSKTQFLNWCISKIKSNERIITIEDTEELSIQQANHVQLYYPDDKGQSECPIDAARCLKLALRLRPDRIITGEVRGLELVDMLKSANTGHRGTFVTLHASSPHESFVRMREILLEVYPNQASDWLDNWIKQRIDMVIQVVRDGQHFYIDEILQRSDGS